MDEQAQPAPRQPEQDRQGSRYRGRHPVFSEESAATRKGVSAWITRRQGYLFFPLLLLEGVNLHVKSITSLTARTPVKGRWIELGMLAGRFLIYFGMIFWLLPFGMAWAFIGVQLAVFGLYMGATFAPNHKGMPIGRSSAT
ncbi:MAG TPA: hypothetical protein VNT27_16985 [Propionibacteriaceae bacterium]|nr:hypothetical protein [Propionibacteriaceae bacterium]